MASLSPRRRSIFTSRLVNSAGEGEHPRVAEDLRHAILGGDEPPGTVIPIDAVAAFFGVSPIPVREALKSLCGEGLVEHEPRVGYAVAKLGFTEFVELYDVRAALEAAALRAAVTRATAHDDAAVRAAHEALADAIAADDARAYHQVSRRFHMALIAPAAMARLTHMYESAWNMTEAARPMARVDEGGRLAFHEEHEAMVHAFVDRDTDRLMTLSAAHFAHLRDSLSAFRDDPDVFAQDQQSDQQPD